MIRRALFLAAIAGCVAAALSAQIDLPRPSPKASVSQFVGVTEITIRYSSPGVKGRKIWGELVPYGEVWRTGANENTTLTVSTPFSLGGREFPAGTYGLQTIPTEGEWTLILSKDADLWGAFNYKPENDALRLQVKPQAVADAQERMAFSFEDTTDTATTVVLRWEKLRVPFTITVDTSKLAVERIQRTVRWQDPYQAANYCIQNNACLEEAGRWLDASIALQETFANLRAKALWLEKKGDKQGAAAWGERALAAAKTAAQPPNPQQVKDLEASVAEWKKG
jgi:hypothetical protein